jgi:hypothetical protein
MHGGGLQGRDDAPVRTTAPDRAFVVRFQAHPLGAPLSWEGRVEHLASYQVARFHSLEELLTFMRRALTDVLSPHDEKGRGLP